VPNFGLDHDIATSQANEQATESKLNHQWVPKWDEEKEKFEVPSPDIEFKLLELQQKSDPICASSATGECPKKAKDTRVIFPIYPKDKTVEHTAEHVAQQEKIHGSWKRPSDRRAVQLKTDVQIESKEQQKAEFANLKSAMKSNWGTK